MIPNLIIALLSLTIRLMDASLKSLAPICLQPLCEFVRNCEYEFRHELSYVN